MRRCRSLAFVLAVLLAPVLCSAASAAAFSLTSPAFRDDAMLPAQFAGPGACLGQNVSPPLRWTEPPAGTRSFAIVVSDADGGLGLGSVHWVAYGIPPNVRGVPAGFGTQPSAGFTGGTNTRKLTTYFGPCSRPGDAPHHYVITVIALDLPRGALAPGMTKAELFAAAEGHALVSSSMVVRYER